MKRLLKYLLIFIVVALVLVAFIPKMLTMGWVQNRIVSGVNETIPGKVKVERYSLGWFGGITVEGFELTDPQGNTVVSFDHFWTNGSLFQLLTKGSLAGSIEIRSLNAQVQTNPSGLTNVEESLGVRWQLPSSKPFSVADVNLTLQMPTPTSPVTVKMTGVTKQGTLSGGFEVDAAIEGEKVHVKANVNNFPVAVLDALATANDQQLRGIMPALFGESLNLSVDEKTIQDAVTFSLDAESPNFTANIEGRVKDGALTLDRPGTVKFEISPDLPVNEKLHLTRPTQLSLDLESLYIPIDFFTHSIDPRKLVFRGKFQMPQTELENVALKDFTASINALEGSSSFSFLLDSKLVRNGLPTSMNIKGNFRKPRNLDELPMAVLNFTELEAWFQNLSTASLSSFTGYERDLEDAIGKSMDINIRSSSKDLQSVFIAFESEKLSIPEMKMHINEAFTLGGENRRFTGRLTIKELIFKEEPRETTLQQLDLPWEYNGYKSLIKTGISGKVAAGGTLDGKLEVSDEKLFLDLNGQQIPATFYKLTTGNKLFGPFFGPMINAQLHADLRDMSGPVKVEMQGENGYVTLKGKVTNGVLTLTDPFYAQTEPTPELGREVLKDIIPPLGEMIAGDQPINLLIDPEGFQCNIENCDINHVRIDKASLEMGKLHFRNQGDIKKVVKFLKAPATDTVSIWFTPQYFSIHKGVLNLARSDLLIMEKYPLATWGKVNFPKDRVDVTIGLSGAAIARAFNLQGLDPKSLLKLPLRGKIDKARVDTSTATARIGALIAKQQGTPQGLLIGTVLDIANGDNGKPPAPTTDPLPWEELFIVETVVEAQEEQPEKLNHRKELEKGAKELIKKLIK